MAITYTDSGTHSATTSSSYTLTLPTHASGNVLAVWSATDGTIATPSGWTQHYSVTAPDGLKLKMFYLVAASSSETNPVLTRTGGAGQWKYCGVFTGTDTTTPFGTAATATSGSGNYHTTGTVTSTVANSMIFCHSEINNGKTHDAMTNANLTSVSRPAGWADYDGSGTFQYSDHYFHHGMLATAGSAGSNSILVRTSGGSPVADAGSNLTTAWSATFVVNAPAAAVVKKRSQVVWF